MKGSSKVISCTLYYEYLYSTVTDRSTVYRIVVDRSTVQVRYSYRDDHSSGGRGTCTVQVRTCTVMDGTRTVQVPPVLYEDEYRVYRGERYTSTTSTRTMVGRVLERANATGKVGYILSTYIEKSRSLDRGARVTVQLRITILFSTYRTVHIILLNLV
jgi:hypothetical protein